MPSKCVIFEKIMSQVDAAKTCPSVWNRIIAWWDLWCVSFALHESSWADLLLGSDDVAPNSAVQVIKSSPFSIPQDAHGGP